VPIPANTTLEPAATSVHPGPATAVRDEPDTEARTFLPIARILCPIDFSDWSRAAVERAVALASPTRAEITAVFVLPCAAPAARDTATGSCAGEADDNMMSAMAEDVEDFLGPARMDGLPVHVSVKRGDTVSQILEQARKTVADVIVMGTHGRSGVERWVLGSVLDGVLRKAPCPVLAVPRPRVRSLRPEPVHGGAEGRTGERKLRDRRVEHALGPVLVVEPGRRREDAAGHRDVLAEEDHALVGGKLLVERVADRGAEGDSCHLRGRARGVARAARAAARGSALRPRHRRLGGRNSG